MPEAWAPSLDDVARHIPTRTRDTRQPGSDTMLGTFTESTTPTAEQAQQVIDDSVNSILADAGVEPSNTTLAVNVTVRTQARAAAEWRAAADIEIAYPNRDADIRVAAALDARAAQALASLRYAMQQANVGAVDVLPLWQAPLPPPYADIDPGSGTETVVGQMGWT